MTNPRILPSLLAVLVFLAACAPPATTGTRLPPTVQATVPPGSGAVQEQTPTVDLTATYTLELLSATPPQDAKPVATSRGPNLEATDPATVSLASGGLQLVEFFRFT